jgi:endogenous inhibitor of DNA gyrase (YacG/DUF329 family)
MDKTYGNANCATCGTDFVRTGPRSKYCKPECKPLGYSHVCVQCAVEFESKSKEQPYCSKACYSVEAASKAGSKGGRPRVHPGGPGFHPDAPSVIREGFGTPKSWSEDKGYVLYYWDHPGTRSGRIYEHRAVAFALHGDAIRGAHVDHIDGDRKNNNPDNLQVLTHSEHAKKTATTEGPSAFLNWCKENMPEVIEAWKAAR